MKKLFLLAAAAALTLLPSTGRAQEAAAKPIMTTASTHTEPATWPFIWVKPKLPGNIQVVCIIKGKLM